MVTTAKTWREVVERDFPDYSLLTYEMQTRAFKQTRLMRGSAFLRANQTPDGRIYGLLIPTEELEERRFLASRILLS